MAEKKYLYTKYLITALIGIIILLALLSSINLLTDQTRALTGDIEREYVTKDGRTIQANYRYSLMRYLLRNKNKYDSLWLGSSRVYDIDIKKMGNTWFKLNFPIGMPDEHLSHLTTLINNGMKLKNIVIALDDFSFNRAYPSHNIRYQTYPSSRSEEITNFLYYLLKRPSKHEWKILNGQYSLKKTGNPIGNVESIAQWNQTLEKKFNNPEHENEILNLSIDKKFFKKRIPHTDKTIEIIKKIKLLCDKNNIHLVIYINPFHYKNFLAQNFDEKKEYYRKLASVISFIDFSGLNSITTDNNNWRELSHFIPPIGDKIIKTIVTGSSGIPSFGVLVTSKTVGIRLEQLRSEIRRKLNKLVAQDKNVILDENVKSIAKNTLR